MLGLLFPTVNGWVTDMNTDLITPATDNVTATFTAEGGVTVSAFNPFQAFFLKYIWWIIVAGILICIVVAINKQRTQENG